MEMRDLTIAFVDIGSRNGVVELPELAHRVMAWGFEPNPVEYEKLITNNTDAFRIAGIHSPQYKSLKYSNSAIGEGQGRIPFYVTPGAGACGVLEPDVERLSEIVWKGYTFEHSFGQDVFAGAHIIEVEMRTLDSFAAEERLSHIDYLKIDVEGAEWQVFAGAKSILPTTGVIKVETCFVPFRKGQHLFSDVDLALREFGFDLLHYEIDPVQIGYKCRTRALAPLPLGFPDPYGQPLSCDAIYVNRTVANPDRALAQAVILLEKNYVDEALFILQTRTSIDDPNLFDLLRNHARGITTGQWLRGIGYQWVDRLVSAAGKLARLGRG